MNVVTLQYRIKDQNTAKYLEKMAGSVSYVWNYCAAAAAMRSIGIDGLNSVELITGRSLIK